MQSLKVGGCRVTTIEGAIHNPISIRKSMSINKCSQFMLTSNLLIGNVDQYKRQDQANLGEGSGEGSAAAASYMDTHDLVYTKDRKRSKVKTHREVEAVLRIHSWKPTTAAPVNGWVDYCYEPPNITDEVSPEIRPLARLPAPSLHSVDEIDPTPRFPPPSPDDWKLAFFHASLDCVQQFADRVNSVTGDEIFVVQEKPFYWVWTKAEEAALHQLKLQ